MHLEDPQTAVLEAGRTLASVRSSLLVQSQRGEACDLDVIRQSFKILKDFTHSGLRIDLSEKIRVCEAAVEGFASDNSPVHIFEALDRLAEIEAALLDIPLHTEDFIDDLSELVDTSFESLIHPVDHCDERHDDTFDFEIDEETLEIFHDEAEQLLASMAENLRILSEAPSDKSALWEIRRCSHTFKGAAGIVGLDDASQVAHQMEDLLDSVVESGRGGTEQVIPFLEAAIETLRTIVAAESVDVSQTRLGELYEEAMAGLAAPQAAEAAPCENRGLAPHTSYPTRPEPAKITSTPVVRVSLDRLDELVKISRSLVINRSALAERFYEFSEIANATPELKEKIEMLLEAANNLTLEMNSGLLQIRMVKFGTLETRMSRAVHATCLDENKKAKITVVNGEVEVDTQVIDMLMEPLLHLLKNAVVHGIEPAETRRMIGKPERGMISVSIEADKEALVLTVSDDGGGISANRLLDKAVERGLITGSERSGMDEKAATALIFSPGLTTAEKVDLNAGRGVGMAIVKESVENRGGNVLVESKLQQGTKFTILMPLADMRPRPSAERISTQPPAALTSTEPLVMIVDDSSTIRGQMIKIVEGAGCRTITATNGAEALELLLSSKWEPDLILSDVEMPQIDGWQFLEYVKTDENFGSIPVVLVTSLDSAECRQRALDLGASGYVNKPLDKTRIEIVINEYCSKMAN